MQARGFDDLAFDPDPIGLLGDRFDHKADQSVAVIGIFEACIRLDDRRRLEVGGQFLGAEKWPVIGKLFGGGAVADEAGAMGEDFRDVIQYAFLEFFVGMC